MNVKVRSHPGATNEDLVDYVKPIARKKNKNFGYTIEIYVFSYFYGYTHRSK